MGASVALQSPFLTRFLEIKITCRAWAAKSPWCTRATRASAHVRARTCCEVAGRAAVRLERAALYSNGDWAAPLTQTAGKLTQTNPLASNTVAQLPQMRCARTLIWRRTAPTALLPLLAALLCPAPLTGQSKMSGATAVVVEIRHRGGP